MAAVPTTPAFYVDETGIHAPGTEAWVAWVQAVYRTCYGADISIGSNTPDGNFLNILSSAFNDVNQAAVQVYQNQSPQTAQGYGLSQLVKLNNITRNIATKSISSAQRVVGRPGIAVIGLVVGDDLDLGLEFVVDDIPEMPPEGEITVTATCTVVGDVFVPAGHLTKFVVGQVDGLQTTTNLVNTTRGAPVESDAALRLRQSRSPAINSQTTLDALYARIADVDGVIRLKIYENDGDAVGPGGQPGHSIWVVVEGGDLPTIAKIINDTEVPGGGTFGSVQLTVVDDHGTATTISLSPVGDVPIDVEVTIQPFAGYTAAVGDEIKAEVARFLSAADIGEDSYITRLDGAANLENSGNASTFVVTLVRQRRDANPLAHADVVIAPDEASISSVGRVTLIVLGP